MAAETKALRRREKRETAEASRSESAMTGASSYLTVERMISISM